jgi:hypothetical protein
VIRLRADFNGLFGDVLCLSHDDTCANEPGEQVHLRAGMIVTAFDEDADTAGKRDDLIATGLVEQAPDWLQCQGSKWILRIDSNGVRHESEISGASRSKIMRV